MARRPTGADAAQTTAITTYDEELAAMAKAAAGMESSAGGGQFFSFRGGIMSLDGATIPNNELPVIVVDHGLLNVYYDEKFNADEIAAPKCYALGAAGDEEGMRPHPDVVKKGQQQSDACDGCPMNAFGTADTGRGKACGNRRRLAVIPAGTLDKGRFSAVADADDVAKSHMAGVNLPVGSVKEWAGLVKQTANALRLPPAGVMMRMFIVPDQKTQFKVKFELLGEVPKKLIGPVLARRDEARALVMQPYNLDGDAKPKEAEGPARGRGTKPAAKKAAAKRF